MEKKNNKKETEQLIKLKFGIYEFDFHPDLITEQMGIKPTETFLKGDLIMPNTKSPMRYTVNGWVLRSELIDNLTVENHFDNLFKLMNPHISKIKKLTSKFVSEFGCTIYLYWENTVPIMHLSPETIKSVADLKSEIDFDVYQFGEKK